MDNRILFPQQPLTPLNKPLAKQQQQVPSTAFGQLLEQELTGIKFSQHAKERLQVRNIQLGQAELSKLSSAMDKAMLKGSRESLILMDDLALVVSVKNRTVITAVDGDSLKSNVFTNIDSAVIV